jgi:four helix bundle protein
MTFVFERLDVYQKSMDFIDETAALIETFPRGYGYLGNQLARASLSIAANLAEGNGRFTKPDRRNFFTIARGSVQECIPLLELASRRGLINSAQHTDLRNRLEEISRMISGLIKGIEKRAS